MNCGPCLRAVAHGRLRQACDTLRSWIQSTSRTMIRLLYISVATPGLGEHDVQDILQASQRKNASAEITGLLVSGGGLFMQAIEGPEVAVLRTYVKILDDPRHSECRIVHITPTSTRLFAKWAMASLSGDVLEREHIEELRAYRTESVPPAAFSNAMKRLIARLNAR